MHAMKAILPVVIVTLVGARSAHAGEAAPGSADHTHVALGVNSPFSWSGGSSLGASLYVGVGEHHAIRANAARYDYGSSVAVGVLSVAAGGDGDEASYRGHTSDLGVGWVYYQRGPWSGLTFELGVLRRARDHRIEDDYRSPERPEILETRTTTYAGRAMLGWSWLLHEHVFLAVAIGISVGHESGTEDAQAYPDEMSVRTKVSRADGQAEGLLRLGFAFDL